MRKLVRIGVWVLATIGWLSLLLILYDKLLATPP